MNYKFLGVLMLVLVVSTPAVHAFEIFGMDISGFWESIKSKFSNNDKEVIQTISPKSTSANNNIDRSNIEPTISLSDAIYTNTQLKASVNNNEELRGYIHSFNYDCLYIETDKGTKFTLIFNPEEGTLKEMNTYKSCEREIYLEESLLKEIQIDGFQAKKIKSYLDKVDLEMSMYFKAIKVFTVG